MDKKNVKIKRIKTHPKLTAAKKEELRKAAELEEKGRTDPLVQADHARAIQRVEAVRLVRSIAESLATLKQKRNLSYADLAERTGIERSALNRLLTGKQENTTIETLVRIATAMDCDLTVTVDE